MLGYLDGSLIKKWLVLRAKEMKLSHVGIKELVYRSFIFMFRT